MACRNGFSTTIDCPLGVSENLGSVLWGRRGTPWIQRLRFVWHEMKGQSPGNGCFPYKSQSHLCMLSLVVPSCLTTIGLFRRRLRATEAQPPRREASVCPQRIRDPGGVAAPCYKGQERKLCLWRLTSALPLQLHRQHCSPWTASRDGVAVKGLNLQSDGNAVNRMWLL